MHIHVGDCQIDLVAVNFVIGS